MRKWISVLLAVLCVAQAALPAAALDQGQEPPAAAVTEEASPETAPEQSQDQEEPTEDAGEEEEPALSETPDSWAVEAVQFCVEQGIVDGQQLRLQDYATRAELAAMLMRLLDLRQEADLSQYTDVKEGDWYYETLSRAVAAGILTGSGNRMKPDWRVSREEAMVMLARCFGTEKAETDVLNDFTDSHGVSDWSAELLAGLIEQGYVSGYGETLHPKWAITRQELIRLIYDLAGGILEEQPSAGETVSHSVVYRGSRLSNVEIEGNLYLTGGETEHVQLDRVTVSGSIVCYGGEVVLRNETTAKNVVIAGADVKLTTGGNPVLVRGRNAELTGGGKVTAEQDVLLSSGTYETVQVERGTVTVSSAATVQTAELLTSDSRITGDGSVERAVLHASGASADTRETEVQQMLDTGFETLKLKATRPANNVYPGKQTIYTEVQLSGVQPMPDGTQRTCDLVWYVDGAIQKRQWDVPLTEGMTLTYAYWVVMNAGLKPTRTVTLDVICGEQKTTLTQTVRQYTETVNTINVEATVVRTTNLYQYLSLSGYIKSVPAGTKVIYDNYSGQTAGHIRLPDGSSGWVRWSDLSISTKNYVEKNDYQTATKEGFVNDKNYTSKTNYLVWISLLKERVNVFQGSQGNWKLIKSFPCSSGKNTTPTIGGVFAYQYRQYTWDFGYYYVKKPMIFNGGHAFHTRTYVKSTGGLLDPTMQGTVSQGCIRMYDEDVNWLWDNLPFQSTVVVY